jgi:hypothetical protein
VGGSDSSITFDDGGGPASVAAPKMLWSANGSGTLFKYKNADAPAGPSILKVAKVAGGLLKAVGKGTPIAVPNGPASIDVVFTLDGGTNRYCMTFAGTGDGSKFLVKEAAAGTCPGGGGAVCGNGIREGTEQCDGSDATACPGNCQASCTCPAQSCGNNVREGSEQCDGSLPGLHFRLVRPVPRLHGCQRSDKFPLPPGPRLPVFEHHPERFLLRGREHPRLWCGMLPNVWQQSTGGR